MEGPCAASRRRHLLAQDPSTLQRAQSVEPVASSSRFVTPVFWNASQRSTSAVGHRQFYHCRSAPALLAGSTNTLPPAVLTPLSARTASVAGPWIPEANVVTRRHPSADACIALNAMGANGVLLPSSARTTLVSAATPTTLATSSLAAASSAAAAAVSAASSIGAHEARAAAEGCAGTLDALKRHLDAQQQRLVTVSRGAPPSSPQLQRQRSSPALAAAASAASAAAAAVAAAASNSRSISGGGSESGIASSVAGERLGLSCIGSADLLTASNQTTMTRRRCGSLGRLAATAPPHTARRLSAAVCQDWGTTVACGAATASATSDALSRVGTMSSAGASPTRGSYDAGYHGQLSRGSSLATSVTLPMFPQRRPVVLTADATTSPVRDGTQVAAAGGLPVSFLVAALRRDLDEHVKDQRDQQDGKLEASLANVRTSLCSHEAFCKSEEGKMEASVAKLRTSLSSHEAMWKSEAAALRCHGVEQTEALASTISEEHSEASAWHKQASSWQETMCDEMYQVRSEQHASLAMQAAQSGMLHRGSEAVAAAEKAGQAADFALARVVSLERDFLEFRDDLSRQLSALQGSFDSSPPRNLQSEGQNTSGISSFQEDVSTVTARIVGDNVSPFWPPSVDRTPERQRASFPPLSEEAVRAIVLKELQELHNTTAGSSTCEVESRHIAAVALRSPASVDDGAEPLCRRLADISAIVSRLDARFVSLEKELNTTLAEQGEVLTEAMAESRSLFNRAMDEEQMAAARFRECVTNGSGGQAAVVAERLEDVQNDLARLSTACVQADKRCSERLQSLSSQSAQLAQEGGERRQDLLRIEAAARAEHDEVANLNALYARLAVEAAEIGREAAEVREELGEERRARENEAAVIRAELREAVVVLKAQFEEWMGLVGATRAELSELAEEAQSRSHISYSHANDAGGCQWSDSRGQSGDGDALVDSAVAAARACVAEEMSTARDDMVRRVLSQVRVEWGKEASSIRTYVEGEFARFGQERHQQQQQDQQQQHYQQQQQDQRQRQEQQQQQQQQEQQPFPQQRRRHPLQSRTIADDMGGAMRGCLREENSICRDDCPIDGLRSDRVRGRNGEFTNTAHQKTSAATSSSPTLSTTPVTTARRDNVVSSAVREDQTGWSMDLTPRQSLDVSSDQEVIALTSVSNSASVSASVSVAPSTVESCVIAATTEFRFPMSPCPGGGEASESNREDERLRARLSALKAMQTMEATARKIATRSYSSVGHPPVQQRLQRPPVSGGSCGSGGGSGVATPSMPQDS